MSCFRIKEDYRFVKIILIRKMKLFVKVHIVRLNSSMSNLCHTHTKYLPTLKIIKINM